LRIADCGLRIADLISGLIPASIKNRNQQSAISGLQLQSEI